MLRSGLYLKHLNKPTIKDANLAAYSKNGLDVPC